MFIIISVLVFYNYLSFSFLIHTRAVEHTKGKNAVSQMQMHSRASPRRTPYCFGLKWSPSLSTCLLRESLASLQDFFFIHPQNKLTSTPKMLQFSWSNMEMSEQVWEGQMRGVQGSEGKVFRCESHLGHVSVGLIALG